MDYRDPELMEALAAVAPGQPLREGLDRILKANMEVEAAVELAHDLDQTGMHCVRLRRNGSLGSC